MELFRENPAARLMLVMGIIQAINVVALGTLFLLDVLLDGRPWMPRKLAVVVPGFFSLSSFEILALFLLAPFLGVSVYEAPGPLSRSLLQVMAFSGVIGVSACVAGLLYCLARRLAGLPPKLSGPMPDIRWAWLLYGPVVGSGLGLILGLVFGGAALALDAHLSSGIVLLPLLHWPLAAMFFVVSLVWAPLIGIGVACSRYVQWRLERLSPAHFREVGIGLTLAGGLVLGVVFWLAP